MVDISETWPQGKTPLCAICRLTSTLRTLSRLRTERYYKDLIKTLSASAIRQGHRRSVELVHVGEPRGHRREAWVHRVLILYPGG